MVIIMYALLRQIVTYTELYELTDEDMTVGHAIFKKDFGPWKQNQEVNVLSLSEGNNHTKFYLIEYDNENYNTIVNQIEVILAIN